MTASWRIGLKGTAWQLIACQDIGWFAAQAFAHPASKTYANAAISLAGDTVTYEDARIVFQQSTGVAMLTTFDFIARLFLWWECDMGSMFKWYGTGGYDADIPALRVLHPGMLTYADWLQCQSPWKQ